ncbi:Rieske 2Fe-2S domain-containing protein [Nocardioides sp. zg-536]|uniref:Rieske-type oxygenase n=1 Tax=Nocardioides faecalis TaxID=2803858 RepID=A0A938Y4B6_9ACTN|nr:Rieske 2Fe-2S domain-containing protein [Nocardioides faecalis]MBM9458932.1 Rieske 2Fe-2S domain-containing protein [Nocardioides faecalis]MBS4753972.1 Rieske 2Fe-2S domain-containing protein [Nocardioides faecalis]QVI60332.1 Rieske 2Fe-2S domain-containing protein [Nocardioides faecalis]
MTDTRLLDQGATPLRYARGWHCLGLASDFRDGKPHAVEGFGTKLVVWVDGKGELNVLDGYCRHMGGDLTQGEVKGDEIACPFHDWRWGGDGKCKQIPYARRVPLRARTQRYETALRNDQLFIWHDPEGAKADHDILPPQLPGLEEGLYTDWVWNAEHIEGSHCRELIDNVVDMAHFYYVHFSFPTSFRNVFEGHTATQFMESKGRPDKAGGYGSAELFLKSEATYYGPSYMINWLEVDYKGFETEVILINTHIPTGADSFLLQYGITVKKPEGMDDDTANYIARKYAEMFGSGFLQDVHIWKNKVPVQNPLLCEEDGPVYQLRRWYEQFYVDVADIAPEMVERFEFEVDTTKANEFWQEEVAENLARMAADEKAAAEAGAGGEPPIMSGT